MISLLPSQPLLLSFRNFPFAKRLIQFHLFFFLFSLCLRSSSDSFLEFHHGQDSPSAFCRSDFRFHNGQLADDSKKKKKKSEDDAPKKQKKSKVCPSPDRSLGCFLFVLLTFLSFSMLRDRMVSCILLCFFFSFRSLRSRNRFPKKANRRKKRSHAIQINQNGLSMGTFFFSYHWWLMVCLNVFLLLFFLHVQTSDRLHAVQQEASTWTTKGPS